MVSFAANVRRRGWTLREIGLDRRKGIAHGWLKFVEGGVLSLVLTLCTCRDIVIRATDTEIANKRREREFFRRAATTRFLPTVSTCKVE